jgi:fumarate hydratase subunit beta
MEREKRITTPLSDDAVAGLRTGDLVKINGPVYTARDAAHKRLVELIRKGEPLPLDLRGAVIYFVGPTPPPPGRVIGAAGPTTSSRMDAYTPLLLEQGLKGMIGKGCRSQAVKDALVKYRAVYFGATGGMGALLSRHITSAEIVAYEDLGPEAIRLLTVEDFPVIVINDLYGGDLYEEGKKKYRRP